MDHLPLPPGRTLPTRRLPGNAAPNRVVRRFQHGPELAEQLDVIEAALPPDIAEDEQSDARVVLKFHAATRLPEGPLNRLRLSRLGESDDWTYFVLSTRESRENLLGLLRDYTALPDDAIRDLDWELPKTWAELVDNIEGIDVYGPEDRRDPSLRELTFADGVETVDCLLWPAANEATSIERVNDLIELVGVYSDDNLRVRVAANDTRPDRTLVRVVVTPELLADLLEHADVERIRTPLRAPITAADVYSATMPSEVEPPSSTAIGVVDGVVNEVNPLTRDYVQGVQGFPGSHTFSSADAHGTAVASIAIWGDLDSLVVRGALGAPHPVVSARVLELAANNQFQVVGLAHVTIEQAIRWLVAEHDVRVINLSINHVSAATSPLRDELTVTIDALARELRVVIVVSTGNRFDPGTNHWRNDYPAYLNDLDARIASPGDAALAVTVGSHAQRDVPSGAGAASLTAIAANGQPSPFTRTGPTRSASQVGTMKPEFSHHGGNWAWDDMMNTLASNDPGTSAIVGIAPQGTRIVGTSNGVSYAAPAVAHEIARIADRYPNAGPNLLRALTALAARPLPDLGRIDRRYSSGYGRPDADNVLESEPHRVILTFEGIAATSAVTVHRLPVPAAFADGVRQRVFRVALAFDPPVRRSRREYVAGSMSVELVRGVSLDEVIATYSRQPSRSEVEDDPSLMRRPLPSGEFRPRLEPGATVVQTNTLIRRDFENGNWDPDHGDYFLVVTHMQSPWTGAQRREYAEQTYALALEIGEQTATNLDLYAAVRAQLRGRVRVR